MNDHVEHVRSEEPEGLHLPESLTGVTDDEIQHFAVSRQVKGLLQHADWLVDLRAQSLSDKASAREIAIAQKLIDQRKIAKHDRIAKSIPDLALMNKQAAYLLEQTGAVDAVNTYDELYTYLKVAGLYDSARTELKDQIEGLTDYGFESVVRYTGDKQWLREKARAASGDDEEDIARVAKLFRDSPYYMRKALRTQLSRELEFDSSSAKADSIIAVIIRDNPPETTSDAWFPAKLLEHLLLDEGEGAIDRSAVELHVVQRLAVPSLDPVEYDLYSAYLANTRPPSSNKKESYPYSKAMQATMLSAVALAAKHDGNAEKMRKYFAQQAQRGAAKYGDFLPELAYTNLSVNAVVSLANALTDQMNKNKAPDEALAHLDSTVGDAFVEGCDRIIEAVDMSLDVHDIQKPQLLADVMDCYRSLSERQKNFYEAKLQASGTVFLAEAEGRKLGSMAIIRGKKQPYWKRHASGKGVIS